MHAKSSHDITWFVTLRDNDLIKYCKDPPRDCEFTELKLAADVLATRYADLRIDYYNKTKGPDLNE
jgi:hypothetical protein